MKKFLLSMAAVACLGFSANAGEVTFNFEKDSYGYSRESGNSNTGYIESGSKITSEEVVITLYGEIENKNYWRFWTDGLRAYAAGAPYFSVTTNNGQNITGVELKVVAGATFVLAGTDTNTLKWTGNAEEVVFKYSATSNKAVKSITVTFGDTQLEDKPEVPAQEFTVASALQYLKNGGEPVKAKISGVVSEVGTTVYSGALNYYIKDALTDTDALQVYSGYGLNGQNFTSPSDLLVGTKVTVEGTIKLYVNETTGVETPEFDSGSIITSMDATGAEPPAEPTAYKNYQELIDADLATGTKIEVEGPVIALYQNGRYLYTQDADGNYMLIYGEISQQISNGDRIASVKGAWSPYNGLYEIGSPEIGAVTQGDPVAPTAITLDKVETTPINAYISISNVTLAATEGKNYTITDANNQTANVYNSLSLTMPADGAYDMVGFMSTYNENRQITPIEFTEVAGIENVGIDLNAPAVYYNLQGQKVANPEKGGVYIIRQGGKSLKAVIR